MSEQNTTGTQDLEARLNTSRARLLGALGLDGQEDEARGAATQPGVDHANGFTRTESGVTGQMASLLMQTWWSAHPARGAAHLARAVLDEQAKLHPWRLLMGGAIAGAVLVAARPVRALVIGKVVGGMLTAGLALLDHGQEFSPKSKQQKS